MKNLALITAIISSVFLTACVPEAATPSTTWYIDADSDSFGDENDAGTASTNQPSGYVDNNTDCNDTDGAINPDASEVADGVDNNCNSQVDEALSTISFTNHTSTGAWWLGFYVNNSSASLSNVEIQDNGSYSSWYSFTDNTDGYYAFDSDYGIFALPISVRLTDNQNNTIIVSDIITSFNAGDEFDSGENF